MEMFRTLGRRPQPTGTNAVLLSGIIYVTYNQKASSPKLVEFTHNAVENKTAMFVYKNKDKKRAEAAIDMKEATVFINYDKENGIGIITRENRIYSLDLEKDRDDLERWIAQWRSVLTVAKDPTTTFSVITVGGADRGSVVLVTVPTIADVKFKYMTGNRKNTEDILNNLTKVQKFGGHDIYAETKDGNSYHFISKRSDDLLRKLQEKVVFITYPEVEHIPTKSHVNSSALYDSKSGYTPADQLTRDVAHVPDDYLTMADAQRQPPPLRQPPPRSTSYRSPPPDRTSHYPPPDRASHYPPERPPCRKPSDPAVPSRRDVPQYSYPSRAAPEDDYLTMDDQAQYSQPSRQPPEEDYLTMDAHNHSTLPPEEDYLVMDQNKLPAAPARPPPRDAPASDYLPMDRNTMCFEDPLIADYLTMGDTEQFDDYTVLNRANEEAEEEEDDDIYFDPSLMPPPVPPRVTPKVEVNEPPRTTDDSSEDIFMSLSHDDLREIRARVERNRSVKQKKIRKSNVLLVCPTVNEVPEHQTPRRPSEINNNMGAALAEMMNNNSINKNPPPHKPVIPARSDSDKLLTRQHKPKKAPRPKSTGVLHHRSTEDLLTTDDHDAIAQQIKSPTLPPRSNHAPQKAESFRSATSATKRKVPKGRRS